MPRLEAKQFLKRILPRSIAVLFATSALMMPVVIPAQVLVTDIPAEGSLDTIATEVGTADTELGDILAELQGSVANLSAAPIVPTGEPTPIVDIVGYATQACGITGAGVATADLALGDTIAVAPILDPVGDPGGASAAQICAQLVAYRAQEYNDTVYETYRLETYIALLAALQGRAAAAVTAGLSISATTQAATILADVQVEMAYWQTRKEAFDIAIKFLEDEQNALTQTKLKGSGLASLVAGGIQATTLTAALAAITPSSP